MANVTQTIENYLSGVTRIPDFNKLPGQVRDLLNGYPDPTFGLLKRPGSNELWYEKPNDRKSDINGSALVNSTYHIIDREGDDTFLLCLFPDAATSADKDDNDIIQIFNLETGERVPVDGQTYALDENAPYRYLNFPSGSLNGIPVRTNLDQKFMYSIASDDKRTVICNRCQPATITRTNTDPIKWSDSGFEWAPEAFRTVGNMGQLPDGSVVRARPNDNGTGGQLRDGWNICPTNNRNSSQNENANLGDGFACRIYINDGKISASSTDRRIGVASPGYGYYDGQILGVNGVNGGKIQVYTNLRTGKVYHVTGPTGGTEKDDFYMMPLASSNKGDLGADPESESGFFWVEVPSPDSAKGLDPRTLPHELIYSKSENKFYFKPIDYSDRWVGNDDTNPNPSFIGNFIEGVFFHNNRLGFLSKDTVCLSRPLIYNDDDPINSQDIIVPDGNPYKKRNPREVDFFAQSSIQLNDGDPIDIAASNNNIAHFSKAISTPQGVVLFSENSQSLLASMEGGPLTPSTANIRNLAVYECDSNVRAMAMDSDYYFLDQTSKSCRLFQMRTNFDSAPAQITEVSNVVHDWIPSQMTDIAISQANNFVMLYKRDRNYIYILRSRGDEQTWFRWKHANNDILHIFSKNDLIYIISTRGAKLSCSVLNMFLLPNPENAIGAPGTAMTPYLDLYQEMKVSQIVSIDENEIVIDVSDWSGAGDATLVTSSQSVQYYNTNVRSIGMLPSGHIADGTTATDGQGGKFLTVPGNFLGEENNIIYGIRYDFEVEFPRFFFQSPTGADYTAYLTVARAKFAFGLSGDFDFRIKTGVVGSQTEWTSATVTSEPYTDANLYIESTATMDLSNIYTVPIHQRNSNFLLKLTSNSPYPLSLDSCMWEGTYSPRYYRRT